MVGKIGVLALQGAFSKHHQSLQKLGVESIDIRYPHDLDACIGLIIPGGESTTMTHQIQQTQLTDPLKNFAKRAPVFGTCAGLILMARQGILHLLDVSVKRNAYGRQLSSFCAPITVKLETPISLTPFFIRAPQILTIHSKDVQVLAENEGHAVCVQQGKHLATSFHPELTNALELHAYFIELCKKRLSTQPL